MSASDPRALRSLPLIGVLDVLEAEGAAISLHTDRSLRQPSTEVADVALQPADPVTGAPLRARVRTHLMGLVGSFSPLPSWYSRRAAREADEPSAASLLLDVLSAVCIERWVSMWRRRAAVPISVRSKALAHGFLARAASCGGVDAAARPAEQLDGSTVMAATDLRAGLARGGSVSGALAALGRWLPDVPISVQIASERVLSVEASDRATLGGPRRLRLGAVSIARELRDGEGAVRLTIGPLSRAGYDELLPGGARYAELLIRMNEAFGGRSSLELELLVPAAEVPTARLGAPGTTRLGIDARISRSTDPMLRTRVDLRNHKIRFVDHW